jgi:flagellar hook-associated protein 3 FlgL
MAGTRITQSTLNRSLLNDLYAVNARLSEGQRKLSSGKELTRPSDDPFAVSRAISLRAEMEGMRQYQRNISEALAWNSVTETALARVGDVILRAKELAVRGANDGIDVVSRGNIATEIDQLIDAAKQHLNADHATRAVFAGTLTDVDPYTAGASDAYAGNAGAIAREIGPGVSVQVNVVGSDVLGNGQAAADDKLLHVLRDLAQHLRGGTPADLAALRGTDLERLDDNLDELLRIRAQVGAVTARLESAGESLRQVEETALTLLSATEDTDMAKTLVEFTTQQTVYQSALKAGAHVVQSSLLDFLR